MNREKIVQLAEQAGFGGNQRRTLAVKLERFAALVAAEEREACASVCNELAASHRRDTGGECDAQCEIAFAFDASADVIRARGQA